MVIGSFKNGGISYAVFPWCGLCFLGIAEGYNYSNQNGRRTAAKRTVILSIVCWIAYTFIRMLGGRFGNYRGWPRGDMVRRPPYNTPYATSHIHILTMACG